MSPLDISPRDRGLVAGLLSLALVGALAVTRLSPKERSGSPLEQPSTFFSADYGTKAAYTALAKIGLPAARLRKPVTGATLAGIRTLFVLGPILPLDRNEERTLLEWVSRGHVLVVSPGPTAPFTGWLDRTPLDPSTAPPGAATLVHDEPWLAGIEHLSMGPRLRATLSGPSMGPLEHAETVHFWKDDRGTLGLRFAYGSGFVVALADASPLSNRGLREADNALLLYGLARITGSPGGAGAVAFDEYHLGFGESDASPVALVKLVLSERFRPGMLQAMLALALALVAAAWRFGSAVPRATTRRRQHGEFARAAGSLLLASDGAGPFVESKLLAHHRAWALVQTGLPVTVTDGALDIELGRRSGFDVAMLLAESRSGRVASSKDVLRTSRVLYRIRKQVPHGTR